MRETKAAQNCVIEMFLQYSVGKTYANFIIIVVEFEDNSTTYTGCTTNVSIKLFVQTSSHRY